MENHKSEKKEMDNHKPEKTNREISFGEVTPKNLNLVKLLNTHIFPVTYNQQFYNNLLKTIQFCKLGFFLLSIFFLI